ncbi:MAG: AraC family transcriptional regulator [Clostridia bacterium]|nr:AraC family transcriptional regulator [Clostridia bacterium]
MSFIKKTEFVKYQFENWFAENPVETGPFKIYQVGEVDTLPGFEVEPNVKLFNEITYIVNGEAEIVCGEDVYVCKAGDVIFNAKGTMHAVKNLDGKPLRYYYISVEIDNAFSKTEEILFEFFKTLESPVVTADKSISNAFQDVFTNLYEDDPLSRSLTTDAIRKILICAMRSFEGKANHVYVPDVRFDKKRIMVQMCSYLNTNVEDINALKKLPEKFGYSYSYLSAFFSKSMGVSLKNYFLATRHSYECELLKSGLSVTAVSEKMGYSSIHAFSNAFTAREGKSPSLYAEKRKA